MMETNREVYFVGSNGDEPNRIYFSLKDAIEGYDLWIDTFDENGYAVGGYSREEDGSYYGPGGEVDLDALE